jgi:hypothetical protein
VPAEATESSGDYWETEGAGQFAGLVYSAPDDAGLDDENAGGENAGGGNAGEGGASSAQRGTQEIDDDAPPFTTAPQPAVPRLNRVRSMPVPPTDEEDE